MSARDDEKDAGDRTTLPPVVRFLEQRFLDQPLAGQLLAGQLLADELLGRGRDERVGAEFPSPPDEAARGGESLFLLTLRAVGCSGGRLCGREAVSWWS